MTSTDQHPALRNEQVLARQLSTAQQTAMALGGAIGTGLFLASGLAVNVAGPAIILSYGIVAGVSLLLGRALAEMAVAHPTAGAFGVYAGMYISPFAGYAVRVSYWLMEVIATGAQLVAASIYMAYWFPGVPGAVWVLAFSVGLLYVNSRPVGRLGTIESWLVLIKVVAVALFVGVAVLIVLGPPAFGAVTGHGAPVNALLVSSLGLWVAVLVRALWPDSAYVWFFGVALFGALLVWLMIFVTHIAYRRSAASANGGGGAIPWGSYVGAALIAAILVSTWWVPGLRSTLVAGGPWLLLLAIGYRWSAAR